MKFKKDLQEALLNTKEAVGAFKAVCNISDDKKEIFRYYMRYQKEHNKLLKICEKNNRIWKCQLRRRHK